MSLTFVLDIDGDEVVAVGRVGAIGWLEAFDLFGPKNYQGHLHGSRMFDDEQHFFCFPHVVDSVALETDVDCPDLNLAEPLRTMMVMWTPKPGDNDTD